MYLNMCSRDPTFKTQFCVEVCAQAKRGNASYCARRTDCNTMQTVNEGHVTQSADLRPQVTLSLTPLTAAGMQ